VNIPNLITLGRIILVPIVFWLLLAGQFQAAFFAFVLAGISDAVDGFLAKRFEWVTELGAYLDPLADKMLIVCIFLALGVHGDLPSWLVIAVVTRDVLIVAGILLAWLLHKPVRIKPLLISKANTAAQIVMLALVLAKLGLGLAISEVTTIAFHVVAVTTFASGAAYVWTWGRRIFALENGE